MNLALRGSLQSLAGEPAAFLAPRDEWGRPSSKMPVIFSSGYSTVVEDTLMANTGLCVNRIARLGYPVLSVNAGGTATFGNDVAIASVEAQVAAFRASTLWGGPRTKKLLLVGCSMGWCDLMNWARTHSDQVAAAVCIEGLTDLTEQWTANRALGDGNTGTAVINTAYGGAYDPAVHEATHSPIRWMGSMPFPILGFYATNDTLIPQATTDAADALSNVTYYSLGAVGHGGVAMANSAARPEFEAFVAAAAAVA